MVLAATFREADTHDRERLAARLRKVGAALPERVMLHTCHRVELVGVAPPGWEPPTARGLHLHRGPAAVERTLLVVGGLDSAVVAEEQLLGQVRGAYASALEHGESGPVLNELFRRAIRFGKAVRSEALPGADASLADRSVRWVTERMGPGAGSALVIGTGTMGTQLARLLAEVGMTVTVASRHAERAERVAAALPSSEGHQALLVDDALADPGRHDVLAVAIRSATAVIQRRHVASRPVPPLVVDLSAPRAVSEEAARLLGARLLDLDRLGLDAASTRLTSRAQRRLRRAAAQERDRFLAWLA
ncbi:MAG: 3-hydroxyacyl-CoA dehydrogenase NAD-binding domain-containing protein, partial [Candidatus Limnocylindria bacterium]